MSTYDLPSSDEAIVARLKEEDSDPSNDAARFSRALELGASPALLSGIAGRYYATEPGTNLVTDLPYISVLLTAGWEPDRVRQFVLSMFKEPKWGLYHQEGFLNGWSAWGICQDWKQLAALLDVMRPNAVLQPHVRDRLVAFLSAQGAGSLYCTTQTNTFVNQVAARLEIIESEYQLGILVNAPVSRSKQRRLAVANRLTATGWNLVYMGYVYAQSDTAGNDLLTVLESILEQLSAQGEQGADMLRWLIRGYMLAEPAHWLPLLQNSNLTTHFARAGWHIVPVTKSPSGRLTARIPGQQTILVHQAESGETPQPDGHVIVSERQLKKLTPQPLPGGHKQYTLRLTPAAMPTPEQLAAPDKVFFPNRRRKRTAASATK